MQIPYLQPKANGATSTHKFDSACYFATKDSCFLKFQQKVFTNNGYLPFSQLVWKHHLQDDSKAKA